MDIENGLKQGFWEQVVDWGTFSNSPIKEKKNGTYINGIKDGVWDVKFIYNEVWNDQLVECSQLTMNYFKTFKKGKLILFDGYLVENKHQIDELKYYSLDSCIIRVENYKKGIKNGEDKYFNCWDSDVYEYNLIMLRNYKNEKLDGKLFMYLFGKVIYEADYVQGEKVIQE